MRDDNQTSKVNKVLVQNQSNGFAVLSKSETDTKANSTPGHTDSVTDAFDEKKGMVQAFALHLQVRTGSLFLGLCYQSHLNYSEEWY